MKPVLYFIHADGQIFGSSAMSGIENFKEKWSYYYWRFPRRIFLSKVSAKYCTCVINTAIVLTRTRRGNATRLNWPTCNLLWKSMQSNTIARFELFGITFILQMHLHSFCFVLSRLPLHFISTELFQNKILFSDNAKFVGTGAIFRPGSCRWAIVQKRLKNTDLIDPNSLIYFGYVHAGYVHADESVHLLQQL